MMTKETCVILIDDDPFTLAMTKQVVKSLVNSEKIKTFCSAKDALNYLQLENHNSDGKQAVPGIILSDLHMPCMDGFQFLDEFARLSLAVRTQYSVFILSSSTDEKERVQLIGKTYFDGFCSKPLTPVKFMKLMEEAHITL